MSLTEQQTDAILSEALSHGYFELDVDGQLPRDPKDRRKAAEELLRQCDLSYRAGNHSDGVLAILHLSESDLVADNQPDTGGRMAATEVDLSQYPVDALKKFEETLMGYPPSDEVNQNLAQVCAEIARKTGTSVAATAPVVEVAQEQVSPQAVEAAVPEVHAAQDEAIRNDLIDRLTFAQMRQHGIDPNQVTNLSTDQLQQIVGGAQEVPVPAPEPVPPPVAPQPEPQGETIQTTVMVTSQPEPVPVASVEAAPQNGVSPEREALESQVTGPMLKAYGRGRVDVPEIGDNELRFMIENPDGRVTQDQLLAARALDEGTMSAEEATERQIDAGGEGPVDPISEQQSEVAQESVGQGPPSIAPSSAQTDPEPSAAENSAPPVEQNIPNAPATSPASSVPFAQVITVPVQIDFPAVVNPADEIIAREHFPLPDEIENPPRIPQDMSSLSEAELYSLHGRFHACESRANVVICDIEDKVFDLERLLKATEAEVEAELPVKVGNTKITDSQRAAQVAADPRVQAIKERLHAEQKPLRKLKVIRESYHRTVERASRQMNRFSQEREGAR